jgi:hypothetical protein
MSLTGSNKKFRRDYKQSFAVKCKNTLLTDADKDSLKSLQIQLSKVVLYYKLIVLYHKHVVLYNSFADTRTEAHHSQQVAGKEKKSKCAIK